MIIGKGGEINMPLHKRRAAMERTSIAKKNIEKTFRRGR